MILFPSPFVHCVNPYSRPPARITPGWNLDRDVIPDRRSRACGTERLSALRPFRHIEWRRARMPLALHHPPRR